MQGNYSQCFKISYVHQDIIIRVYSEIRWCFFASYSLKRRGHLLPFHGIVQTIPPEQIHQIKLDEMKTKNEEIEENMDTEK